MKINKDAHHTHEDIHDHNKEVKKEARSYWRHMMESTKRTMSIGAQQIARMMGFAHRNSWFRREKRK